jgi:ribosomal protein S18 acetylase RimI-like enzyme
MPTLEPLTPRLVQEYKSVRLRALKDTPTAFGSTYAKESTFSDSDWLRRVNTWNGPGGVCYLGMDAGAPCGIIAGYSNKGDPPKVYVASMWVAPTHRRSGLGTMLMDAVKSWAHTIGVSELYLMVTSNNLAAIRFYEKCGFTFTGTTGPYEHDPALFEYEMVTPLRAESAK